MSAKAGDTDKRVTLLTKNSASRFSFILLDAERDVNEDSRGKCGKLTDDRQGLSKERRQEMTVKSSLPRTLRQGFHSHILQPDRLAQQNRLLFVANSRQKPVFRLLPAIIAYRHTHSVFRSSFFSSSKKITSWPSNSPNGTYQILTSTISSSFTSSLVFLPPFSTSL